MSNSLKRVLHDVWLMIEGVMIGLNACGYSWAFTVRLLLLVARILFTI